MKTGNIFSVETADFEKEVFETLVDNEAVIIERIVSSGHRSPQSGWYDQEKDEWVLLLKGSAEVVFEDQAVVKLRVGDFVHIPSHCKHKVSWTDPDQATLWLAVHF